MNKPSVHLTPANKIFLMALQCLLLMVGTMVIWALTESRDKRNATVRESIESQWGSTVSIHGPELKGDIQREGFSRPSTFVANIGVDTKSVHRNMYEVEVFTANVHLAGDVRRDEFPSGLGDSTYFIIFLPTDQLRDISPLRLGERKYEWKRNEHSIYVKLNRAEIADQAEYVVDMTISGSDEINVHPAGVKSRITVRGYAPNPSFDGYFPADSRTIDNSTHTFEAQWDINDLPDYRAQHSYETVSTKFLVGVDRYQMVERALKYSFLIIVLTYLSVFCVEVMTKRYIPLVNYFLTGLALVLFYSLLLSFVEHLRFPIAYAIAALMTIGLITTFMWKLLASRKAGLSICAVLTILYLICFILLTLSNFALLLGSLFLFGVLALTMYVSVRTNAAKTSSGFPDPRNPN